MTIETKESSSGSINNDDGFRKLDVRVENIGFYTEGTILGERFKDLESASLELAKAPCPVSVPVGNVPDLGEVHLLYRSPNSRLFAFAGGGVRATLARQQNGWTLRIHGGGPHTPGKDRLPELWDKAHIMGRVVGGKDMIIQLEHCSIAGYFHGSHSGFEHLVFDRLIQANTRGTSPPKESSTSHRFGNAADGRQVRISVLDANDPSLSKPKTHAGLEANPRHPQTCEDISVELVFHDPFIRHIARATEGKDGEPDLPRLLRNLVRATLGDETLPNPFFRVATSESRGLPDSLRPNSTAWERVRRAFLEALTGSRRVKGAK